MTSNLIYFFLTSKHKNLILRKGKELSISGVSSQLDTRQVVHRLWLHLPLGRSGCHVGHLHSLYNSVVLGQRPNFATFPEIEAIYIHLMDVRIHMVHVFM